MPWSTVRDGIMVAVPMRRFSRGTWAGAGVVLLGLLCGAECPSALAQGINPKALQLIQALLEEKAARSPAQQKLGSHLIYAARQRRREPPAPGVPPLRSTVRTDPRGRALVDVTTQQTQSTLEAITRLGGQVVSSFPRYGTIRAWIPLHQLET